LRGIFLGIVVAIACVPASYAGLVFEGVARASSGGFGSNIAVLVAQTHASERGCVEWDAAVDYVDSIDCLPSAASSSGVPTPFGTDDVEIEIAKGEEAETAELSPHQIRFVFNSNEGGEKEPEIQIDDLVVDFFDATGNLVWGAFQPAWSPPIYGLREPAAPSKCAVCTLYMEEPLRPSSLVNVTR
jgi:hypothetical protein